MWYLGEKFKGNHIIIMAVDENEFSAQY